MMSLDDRAETGVRFGRTALVAVEGELARQRADVLLIGANTRGLLGPGGIRLAGGAEIERAAMLQAPLTIGSAIVTGPGLLSGQGVTELVHCVIAEQLGGPVRLEVVRRTIPLALRIAEGRRRYTVAVPLLGAGNGPGQVPPAQVAAAIVEEIVAHLRRATSRLERIALVSRSAEDVATIDEILRVAHEHAWGLPR